MDSIAFMFMAVMLGGLNTILIAIVIFFLKQPDPTKGRALQEIQELHERVTELSKHVIASEKKVEALIQETRNESITKLNQVNKEVGRQLREIHDNL